MHRFSLEFFFSLQSYFHSDRVTFQYEVTRNMFDFKWKIGNNLSKTQNRTTFLTLMKKCSSATISVWVVSWYLMFELYF